MKTVIVVVVIAVASLAAHAAWSSGDLVIHARKAEWKMMDTGFVNMKSCDPPAPKDALWGCSEPAQTLSWQCPKETVGVLPSDATQWGMFGWPGQRAGNVHPDVYCLIPVDPALASLTVSH